MRKKFFVSFLPGEVVVEKKISGKVGFLFFYIFVFSGCARAHPRQKIGSPNSSFSNFGQ